MGLFSRDPESKAPTTETTIVNIQNSSGLISADALSNAIQEGICIIDENGVVLSFNNTIAKLSGFTPAEAIKLHFKTVLRLVGNDSQPISDPDDPVTTAINSNQEITSNSFYLLQKSGEKIHVSVRAVPVTQNGTLNTVLVISNIESSQELLEQKADFISTASHEMRTPITAIDGYLGLLANPTTATIDDRARDYVVKAQNSTKHLGQLFQDLLDSAKTDENQLQLHLQPVSTVEVTKRAIDDLAPAASSKGISLTFANDQNPQPNFTIKADSSRLLEVLHNLIDNAIKYTPQGSVVAKVDGDEKVVRITVSDTGIGIKEDELPHLFQKFSRIDNSDTREIGGTGLGLYLVKQLTKKMNGQVTVQSTYGKGSAFTVEFPRLSDTQAKFLASGQIN